MTVENAIKHWTIDSAYALMMEEDVGSLEPGEYADFVVFNIDLRDVTTEESLLTHEIDLGKLEGFVDLTVVDGRKVCERKGATP